MKISLNQNMMALSEAFHRGELSLADYRSLRRKEIDALIQHMDLPDNASSGSFAKMAKHIVSGILAVVSLTVVTILIAKFLL